MKRTKLGFTLMEMLVVIIVGSIVIFLVYQTMQNTINVSKAVREKIEDLQRTYTFLNTFSSRLRCAFAESENNYFSNDQISIEISEHNFRKIISYILQPSENGRYEIEVKEKDVLLQTEVSYTGLDNIDSVEFSFFDGESWKQSWDEKKLPQAISITIEKDGSKLFLPVMLKIETVQET